MLRTRPTATRIVLSFLVPLVTGACGLFLTHGPPANHATLEGFGCTTNVAGPVLDALTATASLGLSFKSANEQPEYDTEAINETLVVGIAQATLW